MWWHLLVMAMKAALIESEYFKDDLICQLQIHLRFHVKYLEHVIILIQQIMHAINNAKQQDTKYNHNSCAHQPLNHDLRAHHLRQVIDQT